MATLVSHHIAQANELDAKQLEQQAHIEVELAAQATVESQEDYDRECLEMVRLKSLIDEAHARFDPIVEKAHATHREACNQRNIVITPLEKAKAILGQKIGAFLLRLRQAKEREEQLALEEARHQADERREAEIERAEALGATGDEVAAIIDRPVDVIPVMSRQITSPGPVSARDNYKGRVTNLLLLVQHVAKNPQHLNLISANESAINQLAKALRSTMHVPGIEVVNEAVTSTRTAIRKVVRA